MLNSSDASAGDWQWKKAAYESLWSWLPPAMIAFGLVSNASAFVVLVQPRLRAQVVHLPLTVLSLVDSLALAAGLARHWLRKAAYFAGNYGNLLDPQAQCRLCCKLFELLLYFSLMYSSWIIVIVAAERFVAICARHGGRARALVISRKGLALLLAGALLLSLCTNLHFIVTRDLQANGTSSEQPACRNLPQYQFFVERVFPRIDLALTAFVPFAAIAVCNACIIGKLRRMRRNPVLSSKPGTNRTTLMLLLVTFTFVLLTSPAKLYLTFVGGPHPENAELHTDSDKYYTYRLLWSCLLVLQYSNHCCNFLLYCASNPMFRKEAARLLATCSCRRRRAAPKLGSGQLSRSELETRL